MTQQAQAALRRVIEQYTKNVRFCIICNYVNKIAPAIQSRCTRFRFSPLPMKEVEKRLDTVVEAEKVNLTADGKQALLKLSKGDMRRALNVLQTTVYNCTGSPHPSDIETIINAMLSEEFTTAYTMLSSIKMEKGLALQDLLLLTIIVRQIIGDVRVLLIEARASVIRILLTGPKSVGMSLKYASGSVNSSILSLRSGL
ncbi:Subunit of heteropentameric Replication factor [Salix suchowensis]|nr:Subunit of heteropentameric Replication factor [Salix suchowensis]